MDRTKAILKVLEKNPRGLTTTALAEKCKVSRQTMIKDVSVLLATGRIEMEQAGPAKLYYLAAKEPKGDGR